MKSFSNRIQAAGAVLLLALVAGCATPDATKGRAGIDRIEHIVKSDNPTLLASLVKELQTR